MSDIEKIELRKWVLELALRNSVPDCSWSQVVAASKVITDFILNG
jgi:hypothetical protein